MKTRLKYILDMIDKNYTRIWDTCCDHGKLGIELINNSSADKIHFVDCIPSIIDKLNFKLNELGLLISPRVEVHLNKAENIILDSEKSLVCICGVGGETAIEIINGLMKNNSLKPHDFLLSIQYRTIELREFLKTHKFRVQKEMLCFEGKWAHEIILISFDRGYEIDLIGRRMYNKSNPQHLKHIEKSINHFSKKHKTTSKYNKILDLYKDL